MILHGKFVCCDFLVNFQASISCSTGIFFFFFFFGVGLIRPFSKDCSFLFPHFISYACAHKPSKCSNSTPFFYQFTNRFALNCGFFSSLTKIKHNLPSNCSCSLKTPESSPFVLVCSDTSLAAGSCFLIPRPDLLFDKIYIPLHFAICHINS